MREAISMIQSLNYEMKSPNYDKQIHFILLSHNNQIKKFKCCGESREKLK